MQTSCCHVITFFMAFISLLCATAVHFGNRLTFFSETINDAVQGLSAEGDRRAVAPRSNRHPPSR